MRTLIIGCGYVGSAVAEQLVSEGHEVFALRRSLPEQPSAVKWLSGDVADRASLDRIKGRFDWIVNTVAAGGGGPSEYRRVYAEGTRHLLDRFGSEPPVRYVYTSSTSVYGQDDGSTVTEASPACPEAETGKILVETEQSLLEAFRAARFPAIILRCAGIYGPGRGYWLRQFLAGEAVIDGAGDRWLNMIHRDDVAGAIRLALESGQPGETYNAVDDEPVRQRELYAWLAQRFDRPMPRSVAPDAVLRRRGATNKRVANGKLRLALGWKLKYPTFRQGFEAEITRLNATTQRLG